DLMADQSVTKVFHAARQDIEIVYTQAGLIPQPLFDTQVAAMVCGFGDSISYVNLVKTVTDVELDKGARFTDWSQRPLNKKQLTYALADVTHLRDVYAYLQTRLADTGRTHWLDEEMAVLSNPETYETRPADAWRRMKMKVKDRRAMAILMELAAWRERLAQSQNVPRARILRDDALFDIASQAPTTAEKLGRLRSISDGFQRSQRGKEIIAAVEAGLERDLSDVPSPRSGRALGAREQALFDLLKVLLKASAAEHGVAPKMLADTSDLERLVVSSEPDIAALKGWRREIFGEQALALTQGKIALAVEGGSVKAIAR
ncbi:MAG: ribonuclease D, partial [Pseudomonadota bacterium]